MKTHKMQLIRLTESHNFTKGKVYDAIADLENNNCTVYDNDGEEIILLSPSMFVDWDEYKRPETVKIEHIKTTGNKYFFPMEKGVPAFDEKSRHKFNSVCFVKELKEGKFQVDEVDTFLPYIDNQTPNSRVILYPAGIDHVKYIVENGE